MEVITHIGIHLEKIEREWKNINSIANWCYERLDEQDCRDILIELGWNLRNFFWTYCHWYEGIDFFEKVINVSQDLQDWKSYAWRALDVGWMYWRIGDPKCKMVADTALNTFKHIEYWRGVGLAKHLLSAIARDDNEYEVAGEFLNETWELLQHHGRASDLALVKLTLGRLAILKKDLNGAEAWLKQVLESQDKIYEAQALRELGLIYRKRYDLSPTQDNLSQAQEFYQSGLDLGNTVGRKEIVAHCCEDLALIHKKQGNFELAHQLKLRAEDLFKRLALESHLTAYNPAI